MQLTTREKEVLLLISKGFTDKSIASELHISANTVRTHRQNLRKKLNTSNTAAMLTKAAELKMIR